MNYEKRKVTLTRSRCVQLHNTMLQLTMGGKDLPHEIDSLMGLNIYQLKPKAKERDEKARILRDKFNDPKNVKGEDSNLEDAIKGLDQEEVKVEVYTIKKIQWDSFIARVNKKEDREVRIPGGLEMELYDTIIIL